MTIQIKSIKQKQKHEATLWRHLNAMAYVPRNFQLIFSKVQHPHTADVDKTRLTDNASIQYNEL